ncbi:recombinase family protein [Adlercreutzia sp. ZJ304]|uniref:recombinase family protein n=1 Tax=Adlercreutzia sp. ZJ304 TaxID=2709791 RepID=UPI0013EA4BE2|nr:recombinase family protein [Adlercreutzia sp. ZJ304]
MNKRNYGYARVSAKDQNLARQFDAFAKVGLDKNKIYADKASGKDFERPEYKRLLRKLKEKDVLYVKSIDRLGRNYEEILSEWRHITKEKGADIVVLDMPLLDTRRSMGGLTGVLITDIVLQLLSYVAQLERENTHKRQAEGIAAAKARGVRFGRPKIERPEIYGKIKQVYIAGNITRKEAAARLKVSPSTFDLWLRQDGIR